MTWIGSIEGRGPSRIDARNRAATGIESRVSPSRITVALGLERRRRSG